MVLHRVFRARRVRKSGIGDEVRTWCYIGHFARDIFKQACNISPPLGATCLGSMEERRRPAGTDYYYHYHYDDH